VTYRDEPQQESGQVLVDKRRAWQALALCDWYNQNSDFFYRFVYGDKDTFRLAWHRTGQAFSMPAMPASPNFVINQTDFEGRLLFQHRNGDKWSLHGNRHCPGFHDEGHRTRIRPHCHRIERYDAESWFAAKRCGAAAAERG
jgi:hypothetical protein